MRETTVHIPNLLLADLKQSEFVFQTTEQFEDRYNPNPEFFQTLVDEGKLKESDIEDLEAKTLPSPEGVKTLWGNHYGHAFFHQGRAFIIDEEWESYLVIKFKHIQVSNWLELTNAIAPINDIIELAYKKGKKDGRNEKVAEFKRLMSFDE